MLYKMVFCTVKGCRSSTGPKQSISFHRFPKSPEIRRLWLLAIGKNPEQPVVRQRICSLHFENDHFVKIKQKTYLEKGALPTLNLPTSEDSQRATINDGNQCDEEEFEEIVINSKDYNNDEEIIERVTTTNDGNQYDDQNVEMIIQNEDYNDYKEIQPIRITYLQEIHNYSKNPLLENKNRKLIEMRRKIKTQAQLIRRQKKKITDLKSMIVHLKSLQKFDNQGETSAI